MPLATGCRGRVHRWLAVASGTGRKMSLHASRTRLHLIELVAATAVAGLAGTVARGALVTSVGDISTARSAWLATAGSVETQDLNGQTTFTGYKPPAADAASANQPWLPSGASGAFGSNGDLGTVTYNTYMYSGSLGFLDLTTGTTLDPTGKAFKVSGTSSKYVWLQFTPDNGPVSAFAADFYTSAVNEYTGEGYFSWRVYFTDGTNTIGRLDDGAATPGIYNTYITRAAGTGFIGFRESTGAATISKVEFFTRTQNTNFQIDNLTYSAAAVPEPSLIGSMGLAALGFAVAFRARRRAAR